MFTTSDLPIGHAHSFSNTIMINYIIIHNKGHIKEGNNIKYIHAIRKKYKISEMWFKPFNSTHYLQILIF